MVESTMDEKVRHRLVGIAVIVSLGVIVTPAMLKKSSQPYDLQKTANYRIPKRPQLPKVVVVDKKETFSGVKIAHVNLDKSMHHHDKPVQIAQASPIKPVAKLTGKTVKQEKVIPKKITAKKNQSDNSKRYTVQLASFTQSKNAASLVARLSKKGYHAKTLRRANQKGRVIYQVVVGHEKQKEDAQKLQQRLAQTIKLNGIVIRRHLG